MIIHSPAVYLLPGCTTNCTLHGSKQFSTQLRLLIYTQQSHLFPAKHWILNSLQQLHGYMHKGGYESGCASASAPPGAQGRAVLGAVLQSWLLENLLRRPIICCCCCSFGVMGCPPPSCSCSPDLQGALLSACCFGKGSALQHWPPLLRLAPAPPVPRRRGLLVSVWQPNAAPCTTSFAKEVHRPSAPCEDPPPCEPDSSGFTAFSWDTQF